MVLNGCPWSLIDRILLEYCSCYTLSNYANKTIPSSFFLSWVSDIIFLPFLLLVYLDLPRSFELFPFYFLVHWSFFRLHTSFYVFCNLCFSFPLFRHQLNISSLDLSTLYWILSSGTAFSIILCLLSIWFF